MMGGIDELCPLSAGRLLAIWRETREVTEDPLERSLLCNARVLAECCLRGGERVFADELAVLSSLTGRQMEKLLARLAGDAPAAAPAEVNPAFDEARFDALREG